ncbi:unnamed protein product [Moneuplotes crassus]|uniref:Kelch motif family protein n=1 Tax=Euplotes crassus TaxID=5936 RepID=A0AAD1UFW3_EUPCR|nr:unnamed protein product [Moneuplotes crassus]
MSISSSQSSDDSNPDKVASKPIDIPGQACCEHSSKDSCCIFLSEPLCEECISKKPPLGMETLVQNKLDAYLQDVTRSIQELSTRMKNAKNPKFLKESVVDFFSQRRADAHFLEKKITKKVSKSDDLLRMMRKDIMPDNYKALLRQKMAQNILKQPQMLQSLSFAQAQLIEDQPDRFEDLPAYFGPATRPLSVQPPSLYQQHTMMEEIEEKKIINTVQFPPPPMLAIKYGEEQEEEQFKEYGFNPDLKTPFKPNENPAEVQEIDKIYKHFYTLKSENLHKVSIHSTLMTPPILSCPTILYARIAYFPDDSLYLLGGTSDFEYRQVSKMMFKVNPGTSKFFNAEPMLQARANFGITVCIHTKKIFVAGGDLSLTNTSNEAEYYNCEENTWSSLGKMQLKKSATSLLLIGQRYLYSFGGICKEKIDSPIIDRIERTDLQEGNGQWLLLNLLLPTPISDIGCVQASPEEILLFGGWNKEPVDRMFIIRIQNSMHYLVRYENTMNQPDSFTINGVYSLEKSGMRVCGQRYVHIFNCERMNFTSREILERVVQI